MTAEDFLLGWDDLVERWWKAGPGTSDALEVLNEALRAGIAPSHTTRPAARGRPREDVLACEVELIRLSGVFDGPGYNRANRLRGRTDPVRHFCRTGWRDFHNPSLEFDVWWYWFTALGLDRDDVNPLVHYLLVGRHQNLPPLPPATDLVEHGRPPGHEPVNRAFLFAGYDVDREVDPYVVRFVRELARHGDVYYLADTPLPEAELDTLRPFTAGCWAVHHGRYDFGSYAMLANELVGWPRLETYDEVVLVNDSCYLLRPLDDVFAEMDRRPCDWWGLQASKRDFDRARGHHQPIPMARAKAELVGSPEWHQLLFLHISSYFVALRRPAFTDPGFQRLMEQVTTQRRKDDIIFKYELGMSRQLLTAGHAMETYIDDLYPFHPVYTQDHFELIRRGFPLLKRSFLVENTERIPGLAQWRERVLENVPDAPVEEIQRNLVRVGADDALRASFAIPTDPTDPRALDPGRLPVARLQREDRRAPQHDHWWAFVVDSRTHQLSSDSRALLAVVAKDPSIKKVVLTRSRALDLEGANLEVHPMTSRRGLELLLRCRQVLVSGEPRSEVPYALSFRAHNFIHTGFPHPFRPFGAAVGDDALADAVKLNRIRYRGVVTGSQLTAVTAAAGLFPTPANVMWPVGCPRGDLVFAEPTTLPPDLRRQLDAVRALLDGRRAVLWTWGTSDRRAMPFDDAELTALRQWAQRSDAVILCREDRTDRLRRHADALSRIGAVELTHREVPHLELVYPLVDAMVTDDSPHVVDFLLTRRPVVLYPPPDHGTADWLSDPRLLLPGSSCGSFGELIDRLDRLWDPADPAELSDYHRSRELFLQQPDGRAARRVADRIRSVVTDDVDYDRLAGERRARDRRRRLASR